MQCCWSLCPGCGWLGGMTPGWERWSRPSGWSRWRRWRKGCLTSHWSVGTGAWPHTAGLLWQHDVNLKGRRLMVPEPGIVLYFDMDLNWTLVYLELFQLNLIHLIWLDSIIIAVLWWAVVERYISGIIFSFSDLLEDKASEWEHLILICAFTSCHVSGFHSSHPDRDLAVLHLPRLNLHDSLQQSDSGIVDVAAAVVIHTGASEAVAKKPWGEPERGKDYVNTSHHIRTRSWTWCTFASRTC